MNPIEEEKAVEEFSARLYDPVVPVYEMRGLLADTLVEMLKERTTNTPEEVAILNVYINRIDSALDILTEPGD